MQRLLVKGVIGLVIDVLFLTMALYVLFSLQVVLTAAAIGMIIDLYVLHRWFNKVHKPLFARKRKKQASLLNHVSQILGADPLAVENKEEKLEQKITSLQKTLKSYHARKSLLIALTPFLLYLLMAVIMAIITWGIGKEELQPGDGITYMLLLLSLFPTIRNIIRIEHTWVQGSLASVKFLKTIPTDSKIFIEKGVEIKGKSTKKPFPLLRFGQNGNYK
jgi:ABC-type multidrug transport system fused ATPase/permease subunit